MRIFKNKLFILMLATLVLLILMGVSSNYASGVNQAGNILSIPLSPVQGFLSFVTQKIEGSLTFFKDIKVLKKENEELKAKLDEAERERQELLEYKQRNIELRDALNLKDQFTDYDFVGANIIAKDSGNWFNVFTIDRGSKDGININYPVITSRGLVGKISVTGLTSSKVISIIDNDSTVSCRLSKSRELVVVRGDITLSDRGLCRMDYIPPDADVAVGDTVETSGMGGIYPKGIIVGRVKQLMQVNNELTTYAIVEPAVDFKRLEEVFILKTKPGAAGMGSVGK